MTTTTIPRHATGTPNSTIYADALLVALGSLAIGLLAQISVPIGPVPVTGQTLGVLGIAVALGPRRGPLAMVAYLAQGVAGLPVFAGGTAGPAVLLGPTAGYLVGFAAAALVIGALLERTRPHQLLRVAGALVLGTATIYLFGAAWLARFVGWERVLAVGVVPFLFGDALKIGIVTLAARDLRRRR